jgi:hypothetical protein
MPSIAIFTFDPNRFDDVLEMRKREQATASGKTRILCEWCDTRTGRIIRLVDEGNPEEILAAYRMWTDLGSLEIFPVTHTNALIAEDGHIRNNDKGSIF